LLLLAPKYVEAIMDPKDTSFSRLECPTPRVDRYDHLRISAVTPPALPPKYFFGMNLHQSASILPQLLGSILETMRFLGPENCTLSIVEGYSDDGTFEILKLLRDKVERIGAKYHFVSSDLNPRVGERIETLAKLLALLPLVEDKTDQSQTTVIYFNDVAICVDDILELIHQRIWQNADMTCAMDWTYVGRDPTFYDVWIARGMTGDTFFEIPEDGNWNSAWNLFWNDPKSQQRLNSHKPFQVFSCWNGATAFAAKALEKIRFRHHREKECYQGEPKLFCKDMWYHGYGKIAVVPSVNLEYSNEAGQKIKALKGYATDLVGNDEEDQRIEWETKPPDLVKCMQNYENQIWVPWNEGL
jgi:alpha-1,3-mannosyltransferase